MTGRRTILVALGCFNRSLRISGPNETFIAAARSLSERFRFRVIGRADDNEPPLIWGEMDGIERIAVRRGLLFDRDVVDIVRRTPHELIIVNGFFDTRMTLPLLIANRLGKTPAPIMLAPHGEFSPGALSLRPRAKWVYTRFLRHSGLLDSVALQATSEAEAKLIGEQLPQSRVLVGPNIRIVGSLPEFDPPPPGSSLRVVFLSRIDRKKNLEFALRALGATGLDITFDIYGPCADEAYLAQCRRLAASTPASLATRFRGPIEPRTVVATLATYDLFILPTLGENYGYAIGDALLAGTPVLLSDQTPWRDLAAKQAGADLSLAQPESWTAFIRSFAQADQAARALLRTGARRLAEQRLGSAADADALAACFTDAMRGPGPGGGVRLNGAALVNRPQDT